MLTPRLELAYSISNEYYYIVHSAYGEYGLKSSSALCHGT
jgi:hypothetical protein